MLRDECWGRSGAERPDLGLTTFADWLTLFTSWVNTLSVIGQPFGENDDNIVFILQGCRCVWSTVWFYRM